MIKYVSGDLFDFVEPGIMIPHVTNNCGQWGAGFVVPLAKHYPKSSAHYMGWTRHWEIEDRLGRTGYVKENGVYIANMCAQDNRTNKQRKLHYGALANCMKDVSRTVLSVKGTHRTTVIKGIVAPLFGSGIAGGDWDIIEEMIEILWKNIDVTIVQFPGQEIR